MSPALNESLSQTSDLLMPMGRHAQHRKENRINVFPSLLHAPFSSAVCLKRFNMAKSVKLEDYWKQHNIEGIFKDLTHLLVQKMSPDPVLAIVQHLQKKYPKSFKSLPEQNESSMNLSKTMANNLQSRSMLSQTSEVGVANRSDLNFGRRDSAQSQVSGIVTIPSFGSAFTGLMKLDVNDLCHHRENTSSYILEKRLSSTTWIGFEEFGDARSCQPACCSNG